MRACMKSSGSRQQGAKDADTSPASLGREYDRVDAALLAAHGETEQTRHYVPLQAKLGEVSASHADGGVMSITSAAHDPSARCAAPPQLRWGGRLYPIVIRLALPPAAAVLTLSETSLPRNSRG